MAFQLARSKQRLEIEAAANAILLRGYYSCYPLTLNSFAFPSEALTKLETDRGERFGHDADNQTEQG